ncbi:MAG: zf-HC2 domain-containing protein [Acidobacteria bacterium]|nr:zf-HC2 domain-containing protein [Acidobacteriota bacterium]
MKNSPVDYCSTVAELLPWYLNGTLEAEELAAVEAHLEGCPRCRQEHRETAFAAAAFNTHPAPEQLIRFAFHEMPLGAERSVLEAHLRLCAACSEELGLIEASRDRQHQASDEAPLPISGVSAPLPFRSRPKAGTTSRSWRMGAIAASLLAILAAGYWMWSLELGSHGIGSGGPATAGLETPGGKLPAAESSFLVVAAQPGTLSASPDGGMRLVLAPGSSEAVPTLRFPEGVPSGSLELDVLDSSQRRLWGGSSLETLGPNELQTVLPAEALPVGELSLRLRRRQGAGRGTVGRSRLTVGAPR